MKITIARVGQVFSKFFFCLRVADDPATFLRLLVQTRILSGLPQDGGNDIGTDTAIGTDPGGYGKTTKALSYHIRSHGVKRTIFLRTYAGDIRMFYEIFWQEVYRLPSGMLSASPVIVDAGANIGMTALYFSIVYPQARIFCIEPDADNFLLLRQNLAMAGERVVLIEAALYDRAGEVGFARERWAYNSRIDERDAAETVKAIPLDALLEQYLVERIDLLKIDIEGAEDKLFAAATGWLDRVETILIEVHSPSGVGAIGRKLMENGFHWRPWGRAGGSGGAEAGASAGKDAGGGAGAAAGAALFLASRAENPRLANE